MARLAAGNTDAFEILYGRYEAQLYGFCLRLLGDADEADDAFQDTMIKVLERRTVYRLNGRVRGWLFTIARNLCVDRLRRKRRRARHLDLYAAIARRPRQTDPDVESRDEVAYVLATLPAAQREVLLLYRYYGFSYAEIATMTGSSERAVKQKAYRALVTLRSGRA